MSSRYCSPVFLVSTIAALLLPATTLGQTAQVSTELLSELRFRSIGPAVTGGRIHDVEALPDDPSMIFPFCSQNVSQTDGPLPSSSHAPSI